MGTNAGWPEAFGFSIIGDAPVMIGDLEEGGSAQQAGLQIGDFIVELDGEVVEQCFKDEVIQRARRAFKVPPSLVVVSRMKNFSIGRGPEGGFGITFRGNRPVFIRSVDFNSPAHSAGLRSGDLIMTMNSKNVRYSTKIEVLELLKSAKDKLHLRVVAGGLAPARNASAIQQNQRRRSSETSNSGSRISQQRLEIRYEKARIFHSKIDYYLMSDRLKKTHILTLLRLYSKDRDINSLASSLNILLDTPIERRLLTDIRTFISPAHYDQFDLLVSFNPQQPLQASSNNYWRGSLTWTQPLGAVSSSSPMRNSVPDLSSPMGRAVQVNRGHGSFGFTLSGNAPVFIRSVDKDGPAERAGLCSGDQIMQLNGVNIRGATHSQVVQLLRSSGPSPTLVVFSSSPGPNPNPRQGGAGSDNVAMRTNVKAFKDKMKDVLPEDGRQKVMKQLSKFSQHKEIPELVNSLTWVLDSPEKMMLFHYICQLLPDNAQREFDRVAAAVLAGEPAVNLSGSSGLVEGEMPRFRGSRLSSSSSSSSSSSHGIPPSAGGVASGGMRQAVGGAGSGPNSPVKSGMGSFSSDDVPVKMTRAESATGMREILASPLQTPPKTPLQTLPQSPLQTPSQTPPQQLDAKPPNASMMSTPGGIPLPPNPPPTPAGGVGGVPIPPPPPPALPGSGGSQSNLKRVNWEKLHGAEGTVWKELSGLEDTLEYFEIEEKFANQKAKEAATKKNTKPSVLGERKAYNISILLGHLKLPFDQIKEAILSCNDSVLSEQHLRQMEAFAPDKKECLGFARFHEDPSVLSLADRFSCEMSSIPGYQQRLRGMIFKLHFKGKVDEIKPDLEAITNTSRQLLTSKNFKKVLEVVLAVGNYMNAGNIRVGGAVGFRIKFLTQLRSLKTTDNKSTLLHFVAGTLERKFPHVLEFPGDLSSTAAAARVSGETLEVEVNELMKGLQDIQKDIEEFSSTEEIPGDRFKEVMTEFTSQADQEMTELLKAYTFMKQDYASALKFFGEDPSTMRIDDFFGTFAAFISDFERALKENEEAREKQAQLEKKLQEREEQAAKRQKSTKGSFKFFSRSSKNMEDEIKKEFEAKSKPRKIDVKTLEETQREKAKKRSESQQMDFRHLLKQADHKKDAGVKSGEKRRSKSDSDHPHKSSKQLSRTPEKKPRGHASLSPGAAELTGSWDYIPSPPSSTVDLLAYKQPEEGWREGGGKEKVQVASRGGRESGKKVNVMADYHLESDNLHQDDNDDDDDDDMMASSAPVTDLQGAGNFDPEMDWDSNIRTSGEHRIQQEFDFETQF